MPASEDRRPPASPVDWDGLACRLEAELEATFLPSEAVPQRLLESIRIQALARKWHWVLELGNAPGMSTPTHPEFNYHMARASAQLGQMEEARKFLETALASESGRAWKLRALDDTALASLWTELKDR